MHQAAGPGILTLHSEPGCLQLPEMSTKRGSSAAATMGYDLVAVGGFDGSSFHDSVEAYDTRAGKWRMLAPMSAPRAYAAAANVDGKLYAMGGMIGVVRPPLSLPPPCCSCAVWQCLRLHKLLFSYLIFKPCFGGL